MVDLEMRAQHFVECESEALEDDRKNIFGFLVQIFERTRVILFEEFGIYERVVFGLLDAA